MCVLAIWLQQDPARPLVIGANRDEAYARASAPPAKIEPGIVAGKDLEKGGTWLGYNVRHRLFVAVTNRFAPSPSPTAYSRGTLTLEALRARSIGDVAALAEERVREHVFAGFNLVAVQGSEGVALHYDGALRRVSFGPGAHVISSDYDLNSDRLPEKAVFERFVAANPGAPTEDSLRTLLASHEGTRPICKHGTHYGTVSSTLLTVTSSGFRMVHAPGRPCVTEFRAVG